MGNCHHKTTKLAKRDEKISIFQGFPICGPVNTMMIMYESCLLALDSKNAVGGKLKSDSNSGFSMQ